MSLIFRMHTITVEAGRSILRVTILLRSGSAGRRAILDHVTGW